jgi:hypothetical protein
VINFFYSKNIYSLIISLSLLSEQKNIIFIKKDIFFNNCDLTKLIKKKLNVRFFFVNNLNDIQNIILKIIKTKEKININFFHKENNVEFTKLINKNINFIFLEHGIGNYYNLVSRNLILIFKDYISYSQTNNFKSYGGLYALLKNKIFIDGRKVEVSIPKKVNFIINIITKFYKKNRFLKKTLKQLSTNKKKILVNVPEYLTSNDFNDFISKLLSLNDLNANFFYFKFHPNDKIRDKKYKYIKAALKKKNKISFILNNHFDKVPFESLIFCSSNNIVYSSISNVPFSSSMLFQNSIYVYLPRFINKKYSKLNELQNKTHNFYKKNFCKVKFI